MPNSNDTNNNGLEEENNNQEHNETQKEVQSEEHNESSSQENSEATSDIASDSEEIVDNMQESEYWEDEEFESVGSKREKSFFVKLFDAIENFKMDSFKKKIDEKKESSKKKKEKKKILKKSETTVSDIQKQRRDSVKHVFKKLSLIGFIIILIMTAVIVSMQDNEQQARPKINMKAVLNDTTSFGGIDQKDYFLEQNVLDDKINIVEKQAKKGREELKSVMLEQTEIIKEHVDDQFSKAKEENDKQLKKTKEEILATVDDKISAISQENKEIKKKIKNVNSKVERYKNAPRLGLDSGKIIFPDSKKNKVLNPISSLSSSTNSGNTATADINDSLPSEVEWEYVDIDISNTAVEELSFDTGIEKNNEDNKSKGFEFDLTTALVRVTLINGIKAPTLDIGVKNPTPVLMSIEGVAYLANDKRNISLKGCLLRGVAIGNINTSRAEIFGTHLSCILEGDSGDKYKVEHTFPKNEVWIKGEDGADGVAGLIVDSSGKILAKSAAIGFLQGLTNYFSAQNLVTGGLGSLNNTQNQNTVAQLGTSFKSGVGQGMQTGFDLIIAKYEQLLGGYYPFIDVKGGRKNLTAIFGGKTKLKATPYVEAHLEDY